MKETCIEPIENSAEPAGLYIHIPFCLQKCFYCDFYSLTDQSLKASFVRSLMREMLSRSRTIPFSFDTLYLGGGTPTVLETKQIRRIIQSARRSFDMIPEAEITLEANPGTVTLAELEGCKDVGINRLNIGIQSFQDSNLKFLGRIHTGKAATTTVQWARKCGFANIGVDLMYGIPGQSKESWLEDLKKAVELEPEHLSCYMLTYESGTPMDRARKKGRFRPLKEGLVGQLFESTMEFLESHGYAQYEISNFARRRSNDLAPIRSQHNQKYWSFVPYIGLGPSAHSLIGFTRRWNHRSLRRYVSDLDQGRLPVAGEEVLSREAQMIEAIYLGLRKREGIRIDDFNKRFGVRFAAMFERTLSHLMAEGFLTLDQSRCALTRKGMVFLDSITSMFVSLL